jgi:hypothetical protein
MFRLPRVRGESCRFSSRGIQQWDVILCGSADGFEPKGELAPIHSEARSGHAMS